eukprot:scaffold15555_cov180-Amphora_coffeaeformis.AAC.11
MTAARTMRGVSCWVANWVAWGVSSRGSTVVPYKMRSTEARFAGSNSCKTCSTEGSVPDMA